MQLIIKACDKLFVQKQRTNEGRGREAVATRRSVTRVHEYLCMPVCMNMHTHANCLHVARGLAAVEGERASERARASIVCSSALSASHCALWLLFFRNKQKTCKYKNN